MDQPSGGSSSNNVLLKNTSVLVDGNEYCYGLSSFDMNTVLIIIVSYYGFPILLN